MPNIEQIADCIATLRRKARAGGQQILVEPIIGEGVYPLISASTTADEGSIDIYYGNARQSLSLTIHEDMDSATLLESRIQFTADDEPGAVFIQ